MKDYNEIKVRLPEHLAKWLEEFAKQTARTPDQLLAYILELYYQAWKIGYEMGQGTTPFKSASNEITIDIEKITMDFIESLKMEGLSEKVIKERSSIAKRFFKWCIEKNINPMSVNKEHVDLFIKELNIAKYTKYSYKHHLNKLLKFLVEYKKRITQQDTIKQNKP